MGVTISGMTGAGSIRHNNRSFSAANVDRSRTEQNIVFCNEDLKQVYHMVFDEALAAYNAKKTKTRDKIPDYYEHIRQSKQEKLFHEAIFQIGNMSDCGCGTPDGERAAAALKDFAESFAERNPHLRVFNMVLHMDEATPHLHVDFIPVATEQSRGLSTRVSMKQALKQQGFVGVGRKQTEWAAWMEREKEALTEIAQRHDFEIISLGTNRPHMDLPQFKEAAARLEAVQQQTAAVEREVAELERQRDALKGTVRLLKEADRVNAPLHDIQPEKTLTGAVKGVTVDQVEQLKKMALRSVTDRHKVQELTEENTRLRSQVPSMKKRLEEAQRQQRLEQENRRLRDENYYLQSELQEERSFTERLTDGIGRMLDFLEEHLPERLRPLLEKARELLPDPEIGQQQEQQQQSFSDLLHETKQIACRQSEDSYCFLSLALISFENGERTEQNVDLLRYQSVFQLYSSFVNQQFLKTYADHVRFLDFYSMYDNQLEQIRQQSELDYESFNLRLSEWLAENLPEQLQKAPLSSEEFMTLAYYDSQRQRQGAIFIEKNEKWQEFVSSLTQPE